jgi:hypothetical protein
MDTKLRNIEEVIVNEAVKYTGAHEGTSDTKEIQEVKDKVLAHLATAYSLEKMRQALREFKSSLLAQKMSRYVSYSALVKNWFFMMPSIATKFNTLTPFYFLSHSLHV